MDETAFTYDKTKAPIVGTEMDYDDEGKPVPGSARYVYGGFDDVPQRDLTVAEFEALPERLQGAVKAAPFYVSVSKKKTVVKKDGD